MRPDMSASVTNLNLNLIVNLTSLQQTWVMLFTPWRTHKRPPFSIDPADAVSSGGLKDMPTSIWCKVIDANTSLEFKIEPKMINCNLCSFNILWRPWTFFSRYRNLKTPTTIYAEHKQKNWTLLGQNKRVERTLQWTDFRLVLAPKIQLVCKENLTTAQNDNSLYSSIDGSNSQEYYVVQFVLTTTWMKTWSSSLFRRERIRTRSHHHDGPDCWCLGYTQTKALAAMASTTVGLINNLGSNHSANSRQNLLTITLWHNTAL